MGYWGQGLGCRRGNNVLHQDRAQTWEVERRNEQGPPLTRSDRISHRWEAYNLTLKKLTYKPLTCPQVSYEAKGTLAFIFLREGLFPLICLYM